MCTDFVNIPELEVIHNSYSYDKQRVEVLAKLKNNFLPTTCPDCGSSLFYKHGKRTNIYADIPAYGQHTRLTIERPRYRCRNCHKIITPNFNFVDEQRRITTRLAKAIKLQCMEKSFSTLSIESGLTVNTIKNITFDFIEKIENNIQRPIPEFLGVVPTIIEGKVRTAIVNLANNSLYDILEECDAKSTLCYFHKIDNKDSVQWICFEQEMPNLNILKKIFPNAQYVIGKNHMIKLLMNAQISTENKSNIVKDNVKAMFEDFKNSFVELYKTKTKKEALDKCNDLMQEKKAASKFIQRDFINFVKKNLEVIATYWDSGKGFMYDSDKIEENIARIQKNRVKNVHSFEIVRAKMLYNDLYLMSSI